MSATAQATNHITDVRPDPRPAHGWVWVCICGDDAAGFPNQAAAIEAAVNHEDGRVPLWG